MRRGDGGALRRRADRAGHGRRDLLRSLLGVRAGQRRPPRRPVDARRRRAGAGGATSSPRSAVPTTAASSRRPAAGTEAEVELLEAARQFDRGRVAAARSRAHPAGRPARPAGPPRGGRRAARRASRSTRTRSVRWPRSTSPGEAALARDLLERATGAPDEEVPDGRGVHHGRPAARAPGRRPSGRGRRRRRRPGRRAARPHRRSAAGTLPQAAAALAKGRVCVAERAGATRGPACARRWRDSPGAAAGGARVDAPGAGPRARGRLPRGRDRRGQAGPARTSSGSRPPAHADAAAALLRSLGAPVRTGPKGIGALTRREAEVLELLGARVVQPRDRRPAVHHPQDRRAPRGQRAVQARPAEPGRGGRLRDPAEDQPLDRGPPRCSVARRP